ncbi:hypothetical protein [Spiroplasma endosymbiont of Othius punctulatus]|uniref:hypothetical protein n=1 Tax=Spiroplasma endosymbiont of Othius punctulatus TaxID=3066289 RepID=UPI0030CDCA8F
MIAKIEDKTAEKQLGWNTRIELATRNLIIFVTLTLLMMSFFVGAGCARIFNQFENIIGEQSHFSFKIRYIIVGLITLLASLPISIFTVFPYIFMKRAARIKTYIFISSAFILAYVIACIAVMISYENIYGYSNPYITASYAVIGTGISIVMISKVLLWREVKKQWKMRKAFEYLREEKIFETASEKQNKLVSERDELIKLSVEKDNLEQHVIDNVNSMNGNPIKKKHLSKLWKRKALAKELKSK